MSNRLANETSPYLLAHKENPVDWYPWCDEAFARAKKEDKPIFLSIGYSACHWCHVLAHESFEDEEIAKLLNAYFISIKVDKEERPDIDSVYMAVCQALTGSGGWPTSIFMTPDQKPFYAGTYFPKSHFRKLLLILHETWVTDRNSLLQRSARVLTHLNQTQTPSHGADPDLPALAVEQYEYLYDKTYGGFGRAPKFPTPHNLLFLLEYYRQYKKKSCLQMAEHTLMQMYRGGLFDHIGFGFCRYSTDRKFLVPHFEKMLYDNALLLLSYTKAYTVTQKKLYLDIAEKTATYILREMTLPDGGFFSSQDADSEGEEGKYYLFTPEEILEILGREDGRRTNTQFDITKTGNFEGKSIPNLLKSDPNDAAFAPLLEKIYEFRKNRYTLSRDEKILTSWNSLTIAAMCELYLADRQEVYLNAARAADRFIQERLCDGDTLSVSFHLGKRGVQGFLDEYAAYIFAQLSLYRATGDGQYLDRAKRLCDKVLADFPDAEGGFYLYSHAHQELILRPKETYDGAIPSGNSLMAYNLVFLSLITDEENYTTAAQDQIDFLSGVAQSPMNHAMFLLALMHHTNPPMKITVVLGDPTDRPDLPPEAIVTILQAPTKEYPLKDGKTTYYVCHGHRCLPPTNDKTRLCPNE